MFATGVPHCCFVYVAMTLHNTTQYRTLVDNTLSYDVTLPIPVAARPEAWLRDRSLGGIVGSNPSRGVNVCVSVVSVVCCRVEVSASGQLRVKRSPTECGVSECDHEASTMRRPLPTRGCRVIGKN
jgi:hypothetical protein